MTYFEIISEIPYKTLILYLMYFISFGAMLLGFYFGTRWRSRFWLSTVTGGLLAAFCTLWVLKPAIDDTWSKVEIEQQRLQLRSLSDQLSAANDEIDEKSAAIGKLDQDLGVYRSAVDTYTSQLRLLSHDLKSARNSLVGRGYQIPGAEKFSKPPTGRSIDNLTARIKSEIKLFEGSEWDVAPVRELSTKLLKALDSFAKQFPDHQPSIESTEVERKALKIDDPIRVIERKISQIESARNISNFSQSIISELRIVIDEFGKYRSEFLVPRQIQGDDLFLLTEQKRQKLAIDKLREFRTLKRIEKDPPVPSDPTPSEDSSSIATVFSQVTKQWTPLLNGQFRLAEVNNVPVHVRKDKERYFELRLVNESGSNAVQFEPGSYFLNDTIDELIRPLMSFAGVLSEAKLTPSINALYLVGSADQKSSTRSLYRAALVPKNLLTAPIVKGSEEVNSERQTYMWAVTSQNIQNINLPNLRALWLREYVTRLIPRIPISVLEGEVYDSTEPSLRTVRIILATDEAVDLSHLRSNSPTTVGTFNLP